MRERIEIRIEDVFLLIRIDKNQSVALPINLATDALSEEGDLEFRYANV